MKYKVIGWVSYDEYGIEDADISYAVNAAIIDEIRKNRYMFSGYQHQEFCCCAPILNDGKRRCYSQRGWGHLMAEAYGDMAMYSYSVYSFFSNAGDEKFPESKFLDLDNYVPETDLNEVFNISDLEFELKDNIIIMKDYYPLRYVDKDDIIKINSFLFKVLDVNRKMTIGGDELEEKNKAIPDIDDEKFMEKYIELRESSINLQLTIELIDK